MPVVDLLVAPRRDGRALLLHERQKAALAYAEAITWHLDTDDAFWERLHKHFTEPEIVELGCAVGLTYGQQSFLRMLNIDEDRVAAMSAALLSLVLLLGAAMVMPAGTRAVWWLLWVFEALVLARQTRDTGKPVIQDPLGTKLTYKKLIVGAQVLGAKLAPMLPHPGASVGVLLPNSAGVAETNMAC